MKLDILNYLAHLAKTVKFVLMKNFYARVMSLFSHSNLLSEVMDIILQIAVITKCIAILLLTLTYIYVCDCFIEVGGQVEALKQQYVFSYFSAKFSFIIILVFNHFRCIFCSHCELFQSAYGVCVAQNIDVQCFGTTQPVP